MKRTKQITQTGYVVSGIATLALWGGGTGQITIKPIFIPYHLFSKTNMLRCVNDSGFGCEAIIEADIEVSIKYDNGSEEHAHIFAGVNHPIHTKHFLGWRDLAAQHII